MKKFLILTLTIVATVVLVSPVRSQEIQGTDDPIAGKGVINFKKLADKEKLNPPKQQRQVDNEEKEEALRGIPQNLPVPAGIKVHQVTGNYITKITRGDITDRPAAASPAPVITFNGLLDNNAIIPPDVNGAAGPNHLFEALNSQYRIFNKSGGIISTLSLNAFWTGLVASGTPYSDPHVVYDATSGKWIACTIANLVNGHYGIFVAVSQTNDPTGSWYEYSIDTGPSTTLPDYPLLGYNSRFIVVTTNDFFNFVYKQARITVINKSQAIAGTLIKTKKFFDATLFTVSPAETMDAGVTTEYLLTDYNGNSGGNGYLKVGTITGTANKPVYTSGVLIAVNQPWNETGVDAPQTGSVKLINTGGTKMRAPIYRNGYLWAAHTVYMPASGVATRAATDFWQINPISNSVVQFGRLEDPTNALWTAYPSLAVTVDNDVLIGATMMGGSIWASSVYAYRNHADAANIFRDNYNYQPGLAVYFKDFGSGRNRWGDYSATCIDPSNGSFWTLQEFANTPANKWATQWANVNPVASPAPAPQSDIAKVADLSVSLSPNPTKGAFSVIYQAAKAGNITLSVIDVNGNSLYTRKTSVLAGNNKFAVNIAGIINGNYKVIIQHGEETKQAQLIIAK